VKSIHIGTVIEEVKSTHIGTMIEELKSTHLRTVIEEERREWDESAFISVFFEGKQLKIQNIYLIALNA